MERCPDCKGEKRVYHIACGPTGSYHGYVVCPRCAGSGEITAEQAEAIRVGQERRRERILRKLSHREEAARLGITPQELSQMEQGRRPWPATWPESVPGWTPPPPRPDFSVQPFAGRA